MQRQLLLALICGCSCASGVASAIDGGAGGGATGGGTSLGGGAAGGGGGLDAGVFDAGGTDAGATDGGRSPELWFYARQNLQVDSDVAVLEALMDRASDAGYHGVVLADFKIGLLHTGLLSSAYGPNLAKVLAHAAADHLAVVPSIFPFGYSEAILYQDKNLAEGQPVKGAAFTVQGNGTLALQPSYTGPVNGDFEAHAADVYTGWSWQDGAGTRTFSDAAVAHGGAASARIDPGSGNARIVEALTLTAHRQYHLRAFIKTDSYDGPAPQIEVLDAVTGGALNFNTLSVAPTQGWAQVDFVFNSMNSTAVNLYLGVWGGFTAGHLWFDDVSLEETALVNLIRRSGAPLVARKGSTVLVEGTDLAPLVDPVGFDDWHAPPVPTVLKGGALAAGDVVTVDSYAVTLVSGNQIGACLTEPAVGTWMHDNMAAVAQAFPASPGVFLEYDEMRQVNSCGSCAAKHLSAGQLLAWHVGEAIATVRGAKPAAAIYVWSDMFDPTHNAHDTYYLVQGDLAHSWDGLPADAIVMNWNLGKAASLAFFAGRGNPQIIAGYYDTSDGSGSAAKELAAAAGLSGVRGLMYTTWTDDFSQLEAYATSARAHW